MTVSDIETFLRLFGQGRVLKNYIIPGLNSRKLCDLPEGGLLRVFEMTREQEVEIVPHNHRYNFKCYILQGWVNHRIYHLVPAPKESANYVTVDYDHLRNKLGQTLCYFNGTISHHDHSTGDWYDLGHEQFHTVKFSVNARVVFIEERPVKETSQVLFPVVDGEILDTFYWKNWMMKDVHQE